MKIFDCIDTWQQERRNLPFQQSLGFVPTMGNLHNGHLSLIKQSQSENDLTIVSIFVNPTQFNQRDDFNNYPKTLEEDLQKLRESNLDYCLIPSESMIYPDHYSYRIEETLLSKPLEGLHRPGHFNGVLTVVMKLFNLVRPHRAYFGEKDYQQLQLIRGMVSAFFLDIDIIPCLTVREASQLPMSSRNNRLNERQRMLADKFATIFHSEKHSGCTHDQHYQRIASELKELGIEVEYIEEYDNRLFAAVKIDGIRLIDNYPL